MVDQKRMSLAGDVSLLSSVVCELHSGEVVGLVT